jgi:hypothetical protein
MPCSGRDYPLQFSIILPVLLTPYNLMGPKMLYIGRGYPFVSQFTLSFILLIPTAFLAKGAF